MGVGYGAACWNCLERAEYSTETKTCGDLRRGCLNGREILRYNRQNVQNLFTCLPARLATYSAGRNEPGGMSAKQAVPLSSVKLGIEERTVGFGSWGLCSYLTWIGWS